MEVIKCLDEDKTNALILLLDGDSFEAAQYFGITGKTKFSDAKQKLKDYFAIRQNIMNQFNRLLEISNSLLKELILMLLIIECSRVS